MRSKGGGRDTKVDTSKRKTDFFNYKGNEIDRYSRESNDRDIKDTNDRVK